MMSYDDDEEQNENKLDLKYDDEFKNDFSCSRLSIRVFQSRWKVHSTLSAAAANGESPF